MTSPSADRQRINLLVLGGSGRVGSAVMSHLDHGDTKVITHTIGRYSIADHDRFDAELCDVLDSVDAVLNLAGVAHLNGAPSAADLDHLAAANVNMPMLLARRCLDHCVPMIHVSSSKADDPHTPYGWSKALCDAALVTSFSPQFEAAAIPLVIVKPPALLIGPFDAGKLRRLRWLDRVPKQILPQRTMPVLSSARFVSEVERWVHHCSRPAAEAPSKGGVHVVGWTSEDLDSLHAIHDAMLDTRKNRRR